MRQIEAAFTSNPTTSKEQVEALIDEQWAKLNIVAKLKKEAKAYFIEKSEQVIQYKILKSNLEILPDTQDVSHEEARLNIGHVFHGYFSQIRGRGVAFAVLQQTMEKVCAPRSPRKRAYNRLTASDRVCRRCWGHRSTWSTLHALVARWRTS